MSNYYDYDDNWEYTSTNNTQFFNSNWFYSKEKASFKYLQWLPKSCECEKYFPIWHLKQSYKTKDTVIPQKKHWWEFWK